MAGRFSVESVFKGIDRVTGPMRGMARNVNKFTRKMQRGFRILNKSVNNLTSSIKTGATRALIGITAIAAGAALAIKGLADQADALAKLSRRIDFPIEDLQEWQFVAEQSGLSTEMFDKSLEKFAKAVGEARQGTGTMVTLLKKANPELLKQVTSTNDMSKAMELFIQGIRDAPDAMDKAALATAAFGRTGAKFINIAEQSTGAIEALRKEQRLNGVITKQQAENSEAYNDALNSLSKSINGLRITALAPLLPMLTEYASKIRETIIVNKDFIGLKLQETIQFITDNFGNFVKIGKGLIIVLGSIMATSLALKTIMLATSLVTISWSAIQLTFNGIMGAFNLVMGAARIAMIGFNIAMSANPIGAVIFAVTALIGLGVLLINNWDLIVAKITSAASIIKKVLSVAFAPLRLLNVFGAASDIFKGISGILSSENAEAGGAEGGGAPPQIVSPQDKLARTIEEKRETGTAELTIKDETGRGEITKETKVPGIGITLADSGAF